MGICGNAAHSLKIIESRALSAQKHADIAVNLCKQLSALYFLSILCKKLNSCAFI